MSIHSFIESFKKNKFISEFLTVKALSQFIKYIVTGVLSAGVEYSTFLLLFNVMFLNKFASNSISMVAGFVFGFLVNRFWSFKSNENFYRQFLMTGALFLINLAISNLLIYLFSDILKIIPQISKAMQMVIIIFWNFIIYKKVIFK